MSPFRKPSLHVSLYLAMGACSAMTSTARVFLVVGRSAVMFCCSLHNPFTTLGLFWDEFCDEFCALCAIASATPTVLNSGESRYDAYEGETHSGFWGCWLALGLFRAPLPGPLPPLTYPASKVWPPKMCVVPPGDTRRNARLPVAGLVNDKSIRIFIASNSVRRRAISCFSAFRSNAAFSRASNSSRAPCSSLTCRATITASSAIFASATLAPKIASNSCLSSSRSPFSSHLLNMETNRSWSTTPSPSPNVCAKAGSLRTPMIISRTVTVPLLSLSRKVKIASTAVWSPVLAKPAVAVAFSSERVAGGGGDAGFGASSSLPSLLHEPSTVSPLALNTFVTQLRANSVTSKASSPRAISNSRFSAFSAADRMDAGSTNLETVLIIFVNSSRQSSLFWSESCSQKSRAIRSKLPSCCDKIRDASPSVSARDPSLRMALTSSPIETPPELSTSSFL
mmetsp:Transcript_8439/g.28229  ORF Transcript_8439/g.28229 Transcript_8439/m.28229 type:complete len:453 (-) Transcript_8439:626-1984(-)